MSHRYYLHGDQKEGAPTLFFCRKCDRFQPEEHFHDAHPNLNDYELFLQTRKELDARADSKGRVPRPNGATNLFD